MGFMSSTADRSAQIRNLNDQLRVTGAGGMVVHTPGVAELGPSMIGAVVSSIVDFADFGADNDSYNEHDFGIVEVNGSTVLWKIDYYDRSLTYASPDPADPELTARVLTVMLAEEY
jgi:hypothetical protein